MASREDIRRGLGSGKKSSTPIVRIDPNPSSTTSRAQTLPTIVLPNAKKICSIVLFFIGSFAIGFGAGFGTGYASKECV